MNRDKKHRRAKQNNSSRDIVEMLLEASIVTDQNNDLTLTDSFHAEWRHYMNQLRDRDTIEFLGLLFNVEPDDLNIRKSEDSITVIHSETVLAEWPSNASLVADVAAFITLQEQLPGWGELNGETRDELIARLRVFLEDCPSCEGELISIEPTDSEYLVSGIKCSGCDSIILETVE